MPLSVLIINYVIILCLVYLELDSTYILCTLFVRVTRRCVFSGNMLRVINCQSGSEMITATPKEMQSLAAPSEFDIRQRPSLGVRRRSSPMTVPSQMVLQPV